MVIQVPTVINWSVTPQNGQANYFTLMNTWLFESTSVIASLNTAINKVNEAGKEINNIAENAINAITFDNIAQLKLNSNIGRVDVLGYYTKGDGGGGTFYWDLTSTEADNGGTIIQSTGITTGRWKRVFSGAVNVKWFGAKGDGITDDRQSFIKALQVSNEIEAPSGNTFLFNIMGGLSSAVVVSSNKNIIINGIIKSNYGTTQINPPCLFNIAGDNVCISGIGKLLGDGTIDDTNTGTPETFASLVRVQGNNFIFKDVVIDTPPKVGIVLLSVNNCLIETTFKGGLTAYTIGHTAYFGVYVSGGDNNNINNNRFIKNTSNGKFITCIFNTSSYSNFKNNTTDSAFEKLIYSYGSYNTIQENSYIGDSIGGYTDVYRINGNYNYINSNYSINSQGGCQVLTGYGNKVANNIFLNCSQIGINIEDTSSSIDSGISENKIIHNNISLTPTAVCGIQIAVNYISASSVLIKGNTVTGLQNISSLAAIRATATSPYTLESLDISNNNIISCINGISMKRVIDSFIDSNMQKGITTYPFMESGCSANTYSNNKSKGSSYIGISGLSDNANCFSNSYTSASLSGLVTLAANYVTTVTHGGVAPNAKIFLQNANASAGTLQAVAGLFTTINGNNFSITTSTYGDGTGTEILNYNIIQ